MDHKPSFHPEAAILSDAEPVRDNAKTFAIWIVNAAGEKTRELCTVNVTSEIGWPEAMQLARLFATAPALWRALQDWVSRTSLDFGLTDDPQRLGTAITLLAKGASRMPFHFEVEQGEEEFLANNTAHFPELAPL